jgi:TetR/AcrR family transcriptional regulator
MRFIVSTHWHLHRIFPNELAEAGRPFVDLLLAEVENAADSGLLHPRNPEWDVWFIVELQRSIYHYYAYAAKADDDLNDTKENLWQFCRTALGASRA